MAKVTTTKYFGCRKIKLIFTANEWNTFKLQEDYYVPQPASCYFWMLNNGSTKPPKTK